MLPWLKVCTPDVHTLLSGAARSSHRQTIVFQLSHYTVTVLNKSDHIQSPVFARRGCLLAERFVGT